MAVSPQEIMEEFKLFCLLKVLVEMGQQLVDQSSLDEFQVQLIGQACLLCKNSNIHHH
jgi:hypothetical protein